MLGAIVLRDIPKEEARIDLIRLPIQGGFRGFNMVPPAAWHYVGVKQGDAYVGFWCYLAPSTAVTKVYDAVARRFTDADANTQAQYSQLALSGAMGPALRPYPTEHFPAWLRLVNKIPAAGRPVIHQADSGGGDSRFDQAYRGTHGGDDQAFLAEFQFAFASWAFATYLQKRRG